MDRLLYLLPVLACPLVMGLMMWFMMRGGQRTDQPQVVPALEATERAELDRLRTTVNGVPIEETSRT